MTVEDLMVISENNPGLFKVAFETESYLVDEVQPVTPEESDSYYCLYSANFGIAGNFFA